MDKKLPIAYANLLIAITIHIDNANLCPLRQQPDTLPKQTANSLSRLGGDDNDKG